MEFYERHHNTTGTLIARLGVTHSPLFFKSVIFCSSSRVGQIDLIALTLVIAGVSR